VKKKKKYIAFDIGASNGRCVLGQFDGNELKLDEVSRFDNAHIRVRDHLHWDVLSLYDKVKKGLCEAARMYGKDIASLGVDTWGVDYGLLDSQGNLIGNPYMYRDPQTEGMLEEAFAMMSREEIFQITGIQFIRFNSLFQLLAMVKSGSPLLEVADTYLMMPDLLNYWLTGRKVVEYTNASTSQILDARSKIWSLPLIRAMGIPEHIFPEIIEAGQILAQLKGTLAGEIGLPKIPVVATATHDTAAAVVSVPAETDNFAYLSSGTWTLLGTEIPGPIFSPKVEAYNFGNEGGVCNTIRLLRNIANMWLPQECRRIWRLEGNDYSWEVLMHLASAAESFVACVDPDAPEFMLPSNMPEKIQESCKKTGQKTPQNHGEIMRVCLESLAFKYRLTIEQLTDIVGEKPEALHIIGGGARNSLLCQMAANASGMQVVAGPYEATTIGNLVMQMIAVGDLGSLSEGRALIRRSFPTVVYTPQETELWEEKYQLFLNIIS